jgi:hypothetical protein
LSIGARRYAVHFPVTRRTQMKRLLILLQTVRQRLAAAEAPAEPRFSPREWADLPPYHPATR